MERLLKETRVKKGLFGKTEAAIRCTETKVIIEDSKDILGIIPVNHIQNTIPIKSISNCSISTEYPIKLAVVIGLLTFLLGATISIFLFEDLDLLLPFILLSVILGVLAGMQKKCKLIISDNGGSRYEVNAVYNDFFEVSEIVDVINNAIEGNFEIEEYITE